MTPILRLLRASVSALILALAFTGFCATSGASRLAAIQKLLTNKIEARR